MISFRNLALRRGSRLLLSGVDASLHAGWRIGVIGRNGCGKSSLFAALTGDLEPDAGSIDLPARIRMASVAQETPALPDAALDFVIGGDPDVAAALRAEAEARARQDFEAVAAAHQRLGELNGYDAAARAGRLLHGLGFAPKTHTQAVAEFSGGWRVRLNLARALMMPSDLLLLDEPTNHLDLDAVLWLEQWLLNYSGALMLISHDREFLDGISTHILHLHEGRARLYTGDYTSFERQRSEHLRQQQLSFEKEQAERAHLQTFIDRFKAKASKARQAQSRIKRLEKLLGTEAVRAERALHITFSEPAKRPASLLSLRQAACGYAEPGRAAVSVLRDVDFTLESGDRLGLLGPNGAGKSTLIKTLVGELALLEGERHAHPDLRIGYFAQHTVESLREGASPMDHLHEQAPEAGQQVLRDFLGHWHFSGERAFEPVDDFSGGERARLALALIAWRRPNLLLLDEPTNHLDLDMREALAEALAEFPGAIVLVSHDRHLTGLVCDQFQRVASGRVEVFNGDLEAYAAWLRSHKPASESRRERPPPKAASVRPDPAIARRLERIETRLETLACERARIEQALADPALYQNPQDPRIAQLNQQQHALLEEQEALESQWLELAESQSAS